MMPKMRLSFSYHFSYYCTCNKVIRILVKRCSNIDIQCMTNINKLLKTENHFFKFIHLKLLKYLV